MVKLKFTKIEDVDAGKEIPNYKTYCKNHNKSSEPYKTKCLEPNKKRKYHGWLHLDNLKKDKTIQCGYHDGDCSTVTVKGIGGYRNTCPIGGINGDYPCPSKLQISGFNLADNNINEDSIIESITIKFEHRMNGIGTKTGTPYYGDSNSPNFGANPVSVYFSNKNNKVSKTIKGVKPNNKSDKKYTSVTCHFKDISINDVLSKNFALNIEYDLNLNGNPGIIYLKNLSIDVKHKSGKKIIKGTSSSNTLYTSQNSSCAQTITHTIEAKYEHNTTALGNKIQVQNKPNNVDVFEISSTSSTKTFLIRDTSGIAGHKGITYNLSDDAKTKTTIYYDAIKRPLPTYSAVTEYKMNEDFDSLKDYIIFKNGCVPNGQIKIYIDSIDSDPITLNVSNQNDPNNLLNKATIKQFHDQIKQLECGKHTLYINRGNESQNDIRNNKIVITISPMNFMFQVYRKYDETENCDITGNNSLTFCQSKDEVNRFEELVIKRIDDEPIEVIPQVLVLDATQPTFNNYISSVRKNEEFQWSIDKYYAGEFNFILRGEPNCENKDVIFTLDIRSNHKQNYDYLFTRGQDSTTFDFDYLVAWEGDNIKEPLSVDSIELKNSFDSLRFCSNNSQVGLSQIGTIELIVRNKTTDLLENINIELNILKETEDGEKQVTTEEWVAPDGIFNQFYSLFYEYNVSQKNNIEINNLTPDNDLVDEENVYLRIKKIEAEDSITILLPYKSTTEKTLYLQYLLFEEPVQFSNKGNCDSIEPNEDDPTEVRIDVYDSMLTDLSIEGNTDLLSLDPRYDCPDECYTTVDVNEEGIPVEDLYSGGITYKVTNIDTNDFLNQVSTVQIINSNELIPYAYIVDDVLYNLLDENNNFIDIQEERYLKDMDGNIITDAFDNPIYLPNKLEYINTTEKIKKPLISTNIEATVEFPKSDTLTYSVKTDKNGVANFFIPIPVSLNKTYSVIELLNDIITFTYQGDNENHPSSLGAKKSVNPQGENKNKTFMKSLNNYRKYKPGEVANIFISLEKEIKTTQNYFNFYAELQDMGHSDQVTILYKICNIKNNEGIFKTTLKTNDTRLIQNEISKDIYAGLNTNLNVKTNIDKKIVENHNLNIINISVENNKKENYDVEIQVNLGKQLPDYLGKYDFLDINIDNGDYSIIDDNGNIFVSWMIGKMSPFEKEKGIIKIKAKEIGLSDIKVNYYDYLHPKNSNSVVVQNSKCVKCEEQQNKWVLQDSQWKEFDGVMYKLFEDGKYKRRVNNEWVDKE